MKINMRVGMANAIAALCSLVWSGAIEAQAPNSVKLEIVTRDLSWYVADGTPYANYATVQQRTSPSAYRVFGYYTSLADVVSVNGRPAKGVNTSWENMLRLSTNSTNPPNGRAIADVNGHFTQGTQIFEILQADGTPVGSLVLQGFTNGPVPPGTPNGWGGDTGGFYSITGGAGAFLGARGYCTGFQRPGTTSRGGASAAEDPLRRRERGGDEFVNPCNLIPMFVPEIVNVWHADFSPVTTAAPARAGEVLIASARGLGPTRPGIEPGTPFPASPVQTVNSPIEMMATGQTVELINQIGWPGQENLYRLDFRMPKIDSAATATLQLTVAWIPGPGFSIPVQ